MRAGLISVAAAATALLGAIAGCGQKGALYLPEKTATVVPKPATATPAATSNPSAEPEPAADRAPSNTTDSDKKKITPVPVQ